MSTAPNTNGFAERVFHDPARRGVGARGREQDQPLLPHTLLTSRVCSKEMYHSVGHWICQPEKGEQDADKPSSASYGEGLAGVDEFRVPSRSNGLVTPALVSAAATGIQMISPDNA